MKETKISWTDSTWNPVTGCTRVSEGCRNCYAEAIARKFSAAFPEGFSVAIRPNAMYLPKKWTARRIFVNSMSDLFHADIPEDYLRHVWQVMLDTPQHTYQVLTKRPEVAEERISRLGLDLAPNIWLGVTAENQRCADLRLPILSRIPAPIRFVSAEPLLGPLALGDNLSWLNWVIVGGESGANRRPMNLDWARSLRDECLEARVSLFYKQGNGFRPGSEPTLDGVEPPLFPAPAAMLC